MPTPTFLHGSEAPSAWVTRWSHLVAPQATVLDLACGHGRHMRHFAELGHPVLGVDRNTDALAAVTELGDTLCADLENSPWPLSARTFGAVVVTNYLWRPLWPDLLACLDAGGVLIYETFASGNETVGKPSRADFLLQPGELLQVCKDLRVVAFEEGFLAAPERFVQHIVAVKSVNPSIPPVRYPLKHWLE
jgi:SAM-dependent methyltransferase